MTEHTGGVILFGASGNDAEKRVVTEDGEATGEGGSVEREGQHVHKYRAIRGPNPSKHAAFWQFCSGRKALFP
jgi:hypothetical protein